MEKYMKYALTLAEKGRGRTSPNPVVGAVIVKNGEMIGEGYHEKWGAAHAEINAFSHAKQEVEGSDLYVTLEPCSHYGKTPPCALEIIKRKIKRVYIGLPDPNPLVHGEGIRMLQKAGIEVHTGILEEQCRKQNEIFLKYITQNRPFVVMKTAMTLDGKTASSTGDSKWITSENSREIVQKMRDSLTAIMVGIQTILLDNPLLTVRLPQGRNPIRIVVDSALRIPLDCNVLNISRDSRCIIATLETSDKQKIKQLQSFGAEVIQTPVKNNRVDLPFLMEFLAKRNIDSILLEGGATLNESALQEGIVDRVVTFIAPKIIGGQFAKTSVEGKGIEKIKDAILLEKMEFHQIEQEFLLTGMIKKEGKSCLQGLSKK